MNSGDEELSAKLGVSTQRMGGRAGWAVKYRWRLWISDVLVLVATLAVAHVVRFGGDLYVAVTGSTRPPYLWVSLGVMVWWLLQLEWRRTRDVELLGHGPQEFQRVAHAGWRVFAMVAVVGFLTQWEISRGYLIVAVPLGTVLLLASRAVWRLWIHGQRDRGYLQAQAIVVGPRATVEQMIQRLQGVPRAGYHVIGACLPDGSAPDSTADVQGVPVLGSLGEAAQVAQDSDAEYLLVAGTDIMSLRETRQLGWELEGTGIGLIVMPAMVDVAGPRVRMRPVEGLPLLHIESPKFVGSKYLLKNLVDRVLSLVALVVLALPLAVIALAVKFTSSGPVIFRQERVGLGHRTFTMYKFRSMYGDAEARKEGLDLLQDAGNDVLFKMKDDPRITPVGRVLRRLSLDELPQLFNVLKGDMAIVGPRPPLQSEVELWDERVNRRQLVKPGLTGLWQVSGRSDLDWEQGVRLDLYYAENWSLAGDAVIVLRTAWAVLAGRGAY